MLYRIAVTRVAKLNDRKIEEIVVEPTHVVANDEASATRMAIRKIPNDVDVNEVEVYVRPF